jgi:hypothetical protein
MWRFSFYITLFSLLFVGCAQVVPLTGGKRDTTAPKVVNSIPSNKTVNFYGDNITIKFDEFIQLKDLSNQFIISPTLKTKPTVQSIGKSLIINFNKEELVKNTTYRLFFGNSIVDMHEGNPLEKYEFIFSTGNYLDSLTQQGEILDALFKEPESDMIVGLYSTRYFSDSTIYKKEPNYYCKTNSNGRFKFAFLPDSSFKLVAFNDKNKNLIYDAEQEKIAFKLGPLKPALDSIETLYSFYEAPRKTFLKKSQILGYGKALLIFNKPVSPKITALNSVNLISGLGKSKSDSIYVYFWPNQDSLKLKITDEKTLFHDTIRLVTTGLSKKQIKFPISTNTSNQLLKVGMKLQILFPQAIDTNQCLISKLIIYQKKDSLKLPIAYQYRFKDPITLEISANFDPEKEYVIKGDTAIFKSRNGMFNDSLNAMFKLQSISSLGQIKLNLLFNKKQNYRLQLISSSNKVVAETSVFFTLSESNNKSVLFQNITPGTYKLRIIFDDDENKEWSTGHFLQQQQPERVEIFPKELKVISDWEIEEEVVLKK